MKKPPEWFVRELRRINPRMGVRFDPAIERWRLFMYRDNNSDPDVVKFVSRPGTIGKIVPLPRQLGVIDKGDGSYADLTGEILCQVRERMCSYREPEQEKTFRYKCPVHGIYTSHDSTFHCPKCGTLSRNIPWDEKYEDERRYRRNFLKTRDSGYLQVDLGAHR